MVNFNSGLDNQNRALISQNFQTPEANEKGKADFAYILPSEVSHEIFLYLNCQDLGRCLGVNKTWKVLADVKKLWDALILKKAFGKKQWETYFGDVGEVLPLPKDIHKILYSPCPFWPRKKVDETHVLVLIPETVNGEPLNLVTLGKLVKAPKEGHPTQYRFIWDAIINAHGHQATAKSHWMLMTKDVIEGSKRKSYSDQQALIAGYANYEVPNALDAAICIFMHYINSGERLFDAGKLLRYTRCQENVQGHRIIVGGFSLDGLDVCRGKRVDRIVGVAPSRKFFF